MRDVFVAGVGHTKFGNLRKYELAEILAYAAQDALEDAGVASSVDQVVVGNMGAGYLNHQTGVESAVVSSLCLEPAAAETVSNGPASGASAFRVGWMAVASGLADCVVVTAGEQMRRVTGWEATDFVASLTHPRVEYPYGLTLPACAGMFLRAYLAKHGIDEERLAAIAVRDHHNAMTNPNAHVQMEVTREGLTAGHDAQVMNPPISEPLRLYHTCPVSDGAAAAVLVAADRIPSPRKPLIRVAGLGAATDTHSVLARADLLDLKAVRLSAERAYKMAGVGPTDISVAELHDAFVFLELCLAEEAGLFAPGTAIDAVERGDTAVTGPMPINPSGGLKAKGHPVGGTGMSQIHELVRQLRGEAQPERQVADPVYGMAVNFGGFGNNVVTTILAKR